MPIEVMNNIIGILPNKQEIIVVDPFNGSGTTGIACINSGVDYIGIEIDETYFQISEERINKALNKETQIKLF